ncbi:hypothetical protein ACFSC3_04495 [Sphingomonas floccifaciens]|uniref:Uncharacterized protein n=1 Tax=Sphingomonas floccifaciens TaxID=1844115 RepID=A0ABW4N9L5_9SPHN
MVAPDTTSQESRGISPYLIALKAALEPGGATAVTDFTLGSLAAQILNATDSVWLVLRRSRGGGLAMRMAYVPVPFDCVAVDCLEDEQVRLRITSAIGEHVVTIRIPSDALEAVRVTTTVTPDAPLWLPFQPRDLYPLDVHDDPLRTEGVVEAGQRGLNSGMVYFRIDKPAFGDVLYFQNLTALNPYYFITGTKPDGIVGGEWPELGMLLPVTPLEQPLPAGEATILSDAILVFRHDAPADERDSARRFLQMLGVAYKQIALPRTDYRDWIDRAERTLHDLDTAPEATIRHYGHRYVHPYTAAEYPDIMVQMSLVAAIHDWSRWTGEPHPLEAELKAGVEKFYDPKLKSLRRYLPNVGKDKDADAVDSWYLYHPMLNLGRLALDGDDRARDLLLRSVDFGIRAAQHFDYRWPVQYKITDFSVIVDVAGADGRGQTDVGGIYAWVMLQEFQLTDDKRYLDEARAAIDAAMGLRFNINYQANLTAWGAAACMRLWRITGQAIYLDQSYVYLGSFLHNCEIWESEIGHAVHYRNFLGATCLQDAPYMAMYECFDSFVAFEHFLNDSGPELEPAARMLVAEYCRYALDRAWFYYPDALPAEVVSNTQRENNGHVDRKLSFPLEDLYPDGQPAGQVGQEVYGGGAAMVFATRAFHPVEGAPFRLFCDQFVRAAERTGDRALSITLDGGENCTAGLSLVRLKRRKLGTPQVATIGGETLSANCVTDDRIDFRVPANGRLVLTWD